MKQLIFQAYFLVIFTAAIYGQSEWTVLKPNNSGLPSISIKCLAIDASGNIWIGGNLGSLTRYDNGDWTVYSGYGIPGPAYCIALDASDNIWIGSQGYGLTKFDGANSTVYNASNSGLPDNAVQSVIVDNIGRVWAGTAGGVAIFDGTDWTIYNTSNSNLPHNWIYSFALDNDNNMWVGTGGGLAKSDGSGWAVYTSSNSGLPDNYVFSIAIDTNGDKWIGTLSGGLAKFNDSGWTVYNQSNSGLPANRVDCIVIDDSGNKWIGTTGGGLAKFDDSNWTIFDESNSPLPYNAVYALAIEANGNKWIGTYGGLAVYREDGIVAFEEDLSSVPTDFELCKNYPNPFNPGTTITYTIPMTEFVSITVYDMLGKEVTILVDGKKPAGHYRVDFNASGLPSGMYFYTLQAGAYRSTKKMLLFR